MNVMHHLNSILISLPQNDAQRSSAMNADHCYNSSGFDNWGGDVGNKWVGDFPDGPHPLEPPNKRRNKRNKREARQKYRNLILY
jgi:hypothetical protein